MIGCPICQQGEPGWVCETHPDKPFDHDDCEGAGSRCKCNPGADAGWQKVYGEVKDVDMTESDSKKPEAACEHSAAVGADAASPATWSFALDGHKAKPPGDFWYGYSDSHVQARAAISAAHSLAVSIAALEGHGFTFKIDGIGTDISQIKRETDALLVIDPLNCSDAETKIWMAFNNILDRWDTDENYSVPDVIAAARAALRA